MGVPQFMETPMCFFFFVCIKYHQVAKDAILDLFEMEMGDAFSSWARDGWGQLLSYIGGALIWVRVPWLAEAGLAENTLRSPSNKFE